MSTVTPECGGRCTPPGCDACHAINAGYDPPWGWSLDDWDEYVEEQLMLMVMSPGYIDDTGHAWCAMCWGGLRGEVPGDPADDREVCDGC